MFCSRCGAPHDSNLSFCSRCGQTYPLQPAAKKPKTYGALALIMSITAGVLLIALLAALLLPMFSQPSSDGTFSGAFDGQVRLATSALQEKWTEVYNESPDTDGYLEIIHTRVMEIDPDENDSFFWQLENGMNIRYIVEFTLLSDYYGSAPYYHNAGVYDTVLIYEDGSALVGGNFFGMYKSLTYNSDYSGFLTAIYDYGDNYNRTFDLK